MYTLQDLADDLRQAADDVLANSTYEQLGKAFAVYIGEDNATIADDGSGMMIVDPSISNTLTEDQTRAVHMRLLNMIEGAKRLREIAEELYAEE